jgi:hypothetical protein
MLESAHFMTKYALKGFDKIFFETYADYQLVAKFL